MSGHQDQRGYGGDATRQKLCCTVPGIVDGMEQLHVMLKTLMAHCNHMGSRQPRI